MPISLNGSSGITTPAVTSTTAIGTASGGTNLGGATPFTSGGVVYASSTSALATGSALTFDGTSILSNLNTSTAPRYRVGYNSSTYADWYRNSSTGNYTFESQEQGSAFIWSLRPSAGSATEYMRLTSAGNVGIGTSSPTSLLHIEASATATIELDSTNSSRGNFYIQSKVVGNTNWFQIGEDTGGDFFTIMSDNNGTGGNAGNVGIGTSSPSAKLEVVAGTGSQALTVFRTGDGTAANNAGGGFSATSSATAGSRTARMWLDADGANFGGSDYFYIDKVGNSGEVALIQQSAAAMTFQTNGAEKMRITSAGNVGINTNSPSNMLHVLSSSTTVTVAKFAATNYGNLGTTYIEIGTQNGDGGSRIGSLNPSGNLSTLVFETMTGTSGVYAERARIDSSGNFLVGTTTSALHSSNSVVLVSNNGSVVGQIICNHAGDTGSGELYANFGRGGSSIGSISQNGTTAVSYNTTSDYRLKNTIAPMTGALAKVALLKPVTYKWNVDGSNGEGFIAHELAEVVPHAVTGAKDAVDANGNPKYQGMDVSFLVATLTAALQELDAKFEAYKASHP